jgi:hypothetical protein
MAGDGGTGERSDLMAYGYWLEATDESGYVLHEYDNDHSPYTPGRNVVLYHPAR